MATPIAGLKTMPTNATKNEAIFNEDMILLEALTYRGVTSRSLLDPSTISSPAPSNGTIYLVPDGSPNAVGDWASQGGKVAVYYDGWRYLPPAEGLTLWVTDEAQSVQYRSGAWIDRNELPPTNLTDLADVSLAGSPSPQDGESLTYNAALGLWMAGAGGGTAPTRTTVSLTGASVSQAIPTGCTSFTFISSPVVVSTAAASIYCQLYRASDTIAVTVTGKEILNTTAPALQINVLTAAQTSAVSGSGSGTTRHVSGRIFSPRNAAKKTLFFGDGNSTTEWRHREAIADAATDDDTLRFIPSTGTFSSGSVEIEWYYG